MWLDFGIDGLNDDGFLNGIEGKWMDHAWT
jgi:hypothetical protein